MLLNFHSLIPGNRCHVVGKNGGTGPQTFKPLFVDRRVGGIEQKHIDRVVGNHALHVAKQFGAVFGARCGGVLGR